MKASIVEFSALQLPDAYAADWDRKLIHKTRPGIPCRSAVRTFDFSSYPCDCGRLDKCVYWFAHILQQWWADKTVNTAHERYHALKQFFSYLAQYEHTVREPTDISTYVMDRFAAWIRLQRGWGWVMQRRVWTVPTMLIRMLRNVRPSLIRADYRAFRFSGAAKPLHPNFCTTKETLSRRQIGQILRTCTLEIAAHFERYCDSQSAMKEARANGYDPSHLPDWNNRGQLLLWLQSAYLARRHATREISDRLLLNVVSPKRHGFHSYSDVYRCFLLDHHALVPYLIVIAAHTGANSTSLLAFDVDCLVAPEPLEKDPDMRLLVDAFTDNRDRVYWNKQRSGRVQFRSFKAGVEYLPPDLIKKLLLMTEQIRPFVDKRFRRMLFIHDCLRKKVAWLRQDTLSASLADFRRRNTLPYFTISALRNALAEHTFVHSGGDLLGTQRVLNHRSPSTTKNVYLRGLARRQNDRILGNLSISLVKWALTSTPKVKATRALAASSRPAEALIAGWLELLESPNVILRQSMERISRIIQLRQHLGDARAKLHPIRWQTLCAPLFTLLEQEVLPRFPSAEIAAASALVGSLPPLPRIE